MYGGKVNVEIGLLESETYIVTVRPATFEAMKPRHKEGEVTNLTPKKDATTNKKFVEYVTPPTGKVDISAADIIISVGRGIRDEKNIASIEGLAKELRGEIGCSRPIVDKGWLPKDRQIGSSGKTVKPRLYIATGISGAFQHVMGMKNSDLIIAINKDPRAPIFNIADIGIVDDLNRVIPALTNKIAEFKQ
jgi:electron transfer flavoprotein alpha subunit